MPPYKTNLISFLPSYVFAILLSVLAILMSSPLTSQELLNAGIAKGDEEQADTYFNNLSRAAEAAIDQLKEDTTIQRWLEGSKLDALKLDVEPKHISEEDCLYELSLSRIRKKLQEAEEACESANAEIFSIVLSNFSDSLQIYSVVYPFGIQTLTAQNTNDLDRYTFHYDDSNYGHGRWNTTKILLQLAFLNWYYGQIEDSDTNDMKIAYRLFGGMNRKIDDACNEMTNMETNCKEVKKKVTEKMQKLKSRLKK